ncbi:MAG: membrane protein insertase YidC [Rubrobacter sp.]|nr:membrane protein insertase YidC [Rubrobacter sp.]
MVEFFESLFSPITNVLGEVLMFFHGLGLPWWIAIALLTIAIRALLFPLSVKQIKSMRAMQELRPRLQEIQEKHKGDRQKLQEEQMKLYQDSGVNPLGGCLPILVQIPIFIGIFYIIREFGGTQGMIGVPDTEGTIESFATGGALWFTDLTQPDQLFLLPIISAVTMVAGMEITNKQMEPQQRWIMRIVPVVFVFFTIFFPAGLLVYIVTNNIVTAIQNYVIYNFGPGRQSTNDKEPEKKENSKEENSKEISGAAESSANGAQSSNGNGGKTANGSANNGGSGNSSSSSKRRKKKKKKN